jgi:hypothetical protein
LTARLDTTSREFRYSINFGMLSSPFVSAGFYGPDQSGEASPVLAVGRARSPIRGFTFLSDAQIGDLLADTWSFNVRTRAHPSGEIRGRITQVE